MADEENALATEIADALNEHVEAYRSRLPGLDAFRLQLEGLLRDLLAAEDRPLHHIESRCKSIEGFREKAHRKNYQSPMTEMPDLVGLRIIMYFNSDVTFAAGLIATEFEVDSEQSRDTRIPMASDRFGYESVHLVVSLDERRSVLPEWKSFAGLHAEIQIRTVLQHAWAAVNHLLDYKQSPGLSDEGQRRLNRMAAVLENADEVFDGILYAEVMSQVAEAQEDSTIVDAEQE